MHHIDDLFNRKFTSTRQVFEACIVSLNLASIISRN